MKVQALRGGGSAEAAEVVAELAESVTVLPGRTQDRLNRLLGEVRAADVALVMVAIILACFTGILTLYVNKPFGSLTDYLGALLWGFGVDSSVRGFTAVFKKIGTPGTAS